MSPRQSFTRSRLTAALIAALIAPAATVTFAQQATSPSAEEEATTAPTSGKATNLDKVTVTGSRIKRAEIEGPSPVTVLSAEQIEREGFNTVHDALETLSQNTGFGQNDFNANGGFTPNAGVINLRGMGPGRTLLLINGRRANDYPFPYNGRSNFQNFNNIPAAAVERIEVLAGGASAIYGSDAVAGVVNVILKKNYEGNVVKLKVQTSTDGGRDIGDLQWVGGTTGDNWSVTYAFESYNAEPLFAYQRDHMDSARDNPAIFGTNGNIPLTGAMPPASAFGYQPPIGIQIRRMNASGASTLSYVMPAGRDCSASPFYEPHIYRSTATGNVLGPGCGNDRFVAEQTVANGNNALSAYVYGTYDFNDNLSGWASAMAYSSRARLGGGTEQWQGGPQPGAHFYDPDLGMRVFPIRNFTSEAYGGSKGTFQKFQEDSLDVAFGLSGTMFDRFDWDLTLGAAQSNADRERPRLTVAGATAYFMGPQLGVTTATTNPGVVNAGVPIYRLNLDRFYGPITAADYASMSTMVKYDSVSKNSAANFVLSGDLFELPAGSLGFAAVLEASKQSYRLNSDSRIFPSVRAIYNLTGTGGGGDRSRYAAGLELKIPIFESLTASLSGRYDKYDDITDVNDARTWGAGLEWRPFSNLLVRGSYSTSFKAPDMHYVFAEPSGSFGSVIDYVRCVNAGIATAACSGAGATYNYQVFTTSQGQPTLQEETGKSWTAGFVWDITDSLSVSADYYNIELENVVSVQSGTSILEAELGCLTGKYANGNAYPYASDSGYCVASLARISRNPDTGALTEIRSGPINLAAQGTKGIDGTVRYRLTTDRWGKFGLSLSWSHVLEQTQQLTPFNAVDSYRDWNSNSDVRSRVRTTLTWEKDDWNAAVLMNRVGSFPIWNPAAADPDSRAYLGMATRIAPYFTWNVTAGKKLTDNLSVRFNINNVFNNYHPEDKTNYTYPYYYYGYYSLVGREVGAELTYKFD